MTEHEQFIELIPAYALGAADAAETRVVDAHLTACEACRQLVEEYRQVGDDLLFAAPVGYAPPGLTEDLRLRLNTGARHAESATQKPDVGWLAFLRKPVLALGALALVLLTLTNVYWVSRARVAEAQTREFVLLAQASGITLNATVDQDGYSAASADGVVYAQPDSNVALLCVYDLPQLADDQTYQAWLLQDGQRISVGTFNVNEHGYGVLLIQTDKPVRGYQQLGITVEPAGGSAAPTTPRVMGGSL